MTPTRSRTQTAGQSKEVRAKVRTVNARAAPIPCHDQSRKRSPSLRWLRQLPGVSLGARWDLAGAVARDFDDAGNRMSACSRGSVVVYPMARSGPQAVQARRVAKSAFSRYAPPAPNGNPAHEN